MIGIGTIGRAAESGGSTTYQNGQYIAIITDNGSVYTLYYSDDFGATFNTRTTPLPNYTYYMHINYLGEIMLVYETSLYYAASFTSNWVLIENQHKSGKCDISWDFNTIVYTRAASGGTTTRMPLYISRNKGISFTSFYLSGTPTTPFNITQIKISGDGSKAYLVYNEYSYDKYDTKVCLVDLTTGSVISYKSFYNPNLVNTNYYGDYCSMYVYNSSAGEFRSAVLYNTSFTFLTSPYIDGYPCVIGDGWGVEYFYQSVKLRFFSTPSPYSTIRSYNTIGYTIKLYGIVGDYLYYYRSSSNNNYLYKVDRINNPIIVKDLAIPSNTYISIVGVSKVPPPLL